MNSYENAVNLRNLADRTGDANAYELAAGAFESIGYIAAAITCRSKAQARREYDNLPGLAAYRAKIAACLESGEPYRGTIDAADVEIIHEKRTRKPAQRK